MSGEFGCVKCAFVGDAPAHDCKQYPRHDWDDCNPPQCKNCGQWNDGRVRDIVCAGAPRRAPTPARGTVELPPSLREHAANLRAWLTNDTREVDWRTRDAMWAMLHAFEAEDIETIDNSDLLEIDAEEIEARKR